MDIKMTAEFQKVATANKSSIAQNGASQAQKDRLARAQKAAEKFGLSEKQRRQKLFIKK
ncbi:MAG: hypothetical protein AAGJ94_11445 [Pseudomonadota bacterium]